MNSNCYLWDNGGFHHIKFEFIYKILYRLSDKLRMNYLIIYIHRILLWNLSSRLIKYENTLAHHHSIVCRCILLFLNSKSSLRHCVDYVSTQFDSLVLMCANFKVWIAPSTIIKIPTLLLYLLKKKKITIVWNRVKKN